MSNGSSEFPESIFTIKTKSYHKPTRFLKFYLIAILPIQCIYSLYTIINEFENGFEFGIHLAIDFSMLYNIFMLILTPITIIVLCKLNSFSYKLHLFYIIFNRSGMFISACALASFASQYGIDEQPYLDSAANAFIGALIFWIPIIVYFAKRKDLFYLPLHQISDSDIPNPERLYEGSYITNTDTTNNQFNIIVKNITLDQYFNYRLEVEKTNWRYAGAKVTDFKNRKLIPENYEFAAYINSKNYYLYLAFDKTTNSLHIVPANFHINFLGADKTPIQTQLEETNLENQENKPIEITTTDTFNTLESSYNSETSLETIKEPAIVPVSAPSLQEKVKCRFCKLCGGEIDSETKCCTKCGKQYFKGIKNYLKIFKNKSNLLNKIIISILVVAVIGQTIGLIYLGREYKEKNSTVTAQSKRIKTMESNITKLTNENNTLKDKASFLDDHIVIMTSRSSSAKYHKYGCRWIKDRSFWAFNTEQVADRYSPCNYCH